MKRDLKGNTLEELEKLFVECGRERFRARQILRWMYGKLETDFSGMTDLSKQFRREIEEGFFISRFGKGSQRVSRDGTVKFLFKLDDGEGIETVYIPDGERKTVCVSTQVGCRMGCAFCATGEGNFSRNLTSAEIVNQVCSVDGLLKERGEKLTNVVFMGMGEPMDNIDEVLRAIRILNCDFAFRLPLKRITVSTCGLIPQLKRFVAECDASIAVSINAAFDDVRSRLMPVNRKHPLSELIQCIRDIEPKRNRKVTIEYLLIEGVNDSRDDAERLASLLKRIRVKINLIAYNQTKTGYFRSPRPDAVDRFREILVQDGIQTIIRGRRGADIEAACGQLRRRLAKETNNP